MWPPSGLGPASAEPVHSDWHLQMTVRDWTTHLQPKANSLCERLGGSNSGRHCRAIIRTDSSSTIETASSPRKSIRALPSCGRRLTSVVLDQACVPARLCGGTCRRCAEKPEMVTFTFNSLAMRSSPQVGFSAAISPMSLRRSLCIRGLPTGRDFQRHNRRNPYPVPADERIGLDVHQGVTPREHAA